MSVPLVVTQKVLISIQRKDIVTYVNFAATTILAYDYAITLGMEASLVWPSAWSVTKVLFLITRYLPFIDSALVLYHQVGVDLSPKVCADTNKASGWLFMFGMIVAEAILAIRTWSVYHKDRRLTIALPILLLAISVSSLTVMYFFLESMKFAPTLQKPLSGCSLLDASSILIADWLLLTLLEFIMLVLMGVKGVQAYRQGGSSKLMRVVYSDGIVYYIYLFGLTAANIVVLVSLPGEFANMFSQLERVMHAVLTCRVVLGIRQEASNNNGLVHMDEASSNGAQSSMRPGEGALRHLRSMQAPKGSYKDTEVSRVPWAVTS